MKREAADNHIPSPNPKKIKKLIESEKSLSSLHDQLSHKDEPLNQDDVVYFQKQCIYRLYKIQKNRSIKLFNKLNHFKADNHSTNLQLLTLKQWWFQILSLFKTFYPNITDDDVADRNNETENLFLFSDISMDDELSKLKSQLQSYLNFITSNKDTSIDLNSKKIILKLQSEISDLNISNKSLVKNNESLKSDVDELNITIDKLLNDINRLSSKSLLRIKEEEDISKLTNSSSPSTTNDNNRTNSNSNSNINNSNNNNDNNNNISSSSSSRSNISEKDQINNDNSATDYVPISGENKSLINELNATVVSLTSKNNTINEQLDSKLKNIDDLNSQIVNLNNKLTNLSSDDILNSKVYKSLLNDNSNLNSKVNELNLLNEKLKNQLFELESSFQINKDKIESKFKTELNNNNQYISKLENDINRIRSDRDTLQSKLSILSKEKSKNDYLILFNEQVDILNLRINQLEENKLNNISNNFNDDQSKILINEIKQIEEAFKKNRDLNISKLKSNYDNEILINKLSIEKSKADEKYFQAMRSKDALSSQNKILSSNLTKQMELIEILKSNELELNNKLKIDSKIFDKLNKIEKLYNSQIQSLKNEIDKLSNFKLNKLESERLLNDKLSKILIELNQSKKKILLLEQDLNSEKSRADSYNKLLNNSNSSNNLNTDSSLDSDMANALKSMTKCSLCTKNFKNVALKTCGHCFCSDCIDNRLNSRMRKCPSCNQQFSNYDVLTIHL